MDRIELTQSQKIRDAQARIQFEDDTHRAALEDNPDTVHVPASTWIAICFLALSFAPAAALGFVTIAGVVVPVSQALGGFDKLGWIVGAWSLATAVSYSLAGTLSDVFGRRIPILTGECLTLLGCIVCGTAQNIEALIAGEALIGLGAGTLFVAYAGVPEMLPNKWRGVGMGILEGGIAFPWGLVATLLGNALTQYATWRWIFYIGIIVEAIALVGTAIFYHPNPRPRGDYDKTRWQEVKEIDWIGLTLFTTGLTTLLVGLTWGGSANHPWKSASTIVPIVLGGLVTASAFLYDFTLAKNPMFPFNLLREFRQFTVLLIIVFISGMSFYAMVPLVPQGFLYMFTNDGVMIGVYSIPYGFLAIVYGVIAPAMVHKIGHMKWLLLLFLVIQAALTAAVAGAVHPNKLQGWIWLTAFGVPMFTGIIILTYTIASLHVPHSKLGVAIGLLGTFRSAGGAVGNAIFNTVFNNRFNSYVGPEVAPVALQSGFSVQDLPKIIPATIQYNLGIANAFDGIQGISPAIRDALQAAVRSAYGHAFMIVFLASLGPTLFGLICGFFVEDPTQYLTNHVQAAMGKASSDDETPETRSKDEAVHLEDTSTNYSQKGF